MEKDPKSTYIKLPYEDFLSLKTVVDKVNRKIDPLFNGAEFDVTKMDVVLCLKLMEWYPLATEQKQKFKELMDVLTLFNKYYRCIIAINDSKQLQKFKKVVQTFKSKLEAFGVPDANEEESILRKAEFEAFLQINDYKANLAQLEQRCIVEINARPQDLALVSADSIFVRIKTRLMCSAFITQLSIPINYIANASCWSALSVVVCDNIDHLTNQQVWSLLKLYNISIPNAATLQLILHIIRAFCKMNTNGLYGVLRQYANYRKITANNSVKVTQATATIKKPETRRSFGIIARQKPKVAEHSWGKPSTPEYWAMHNTFFNQPVSFSSKTKKGKPLIASSQENSSASSSNQQQVKTNVQTSNSQASQASQSASQAQNANADPDKPKFITQHTSTFTKFMRNMKKTLKGDTNDMISGLPVSDENKVFLGMGLFGLLSSIRIEGIYKVGRFIDYHADLMLGQQRRGRPPTKPEVSFQVNRRMALINAGLITYAYRDQISRGLKDLVYDIDYEPSQTSDGMMFGGTSEDDAKEETLLSKIDDNENQLEQETKYFIDLEIDLLKKELMKPALQSAFECLKADALGIPYTVSYVNQPISNIKDLISKVWEEYDF